MTMSAASTLVNSAGHSSPGPMSASTPGSSARSTHRTVSPATPALRSCSSNWPAISSLLDGAGLLFNEQTSAMARRDGVSAEDMVARYPDTATPNDAPVARPALSPHRAKGAVVAQGSSGQPIEKAAAATPQAQL